MMRFNAPPGWPQPPAGWVPPAGWKPDPRWPEPPAGWQLWLLDDETPPKEQPLPETAPTPQAPALSPDLVEHPPASPAPGANPAPPSETVLLPAPTAAPGIDALLRRIAELETALASRGVETDVVELDDQRVLQDVGIYRYHHPLEDAAAYKDQLAALNARIDAFIKSGAAVLAADTFTMNGSLAQGRKMVADFSKLMLRAYNAEADNCVRSLRAGNIATARRRLENAVRGIEKLGVLMEMRIDPGYHQLRIEELQLTADYQMKLQEERERAREERERLREQRRAEQELAAERERLEKERAHYLTVLQQLRDNGDTAAADELSGRLADIEVAIKENDYRTVNIRAGYIYVISNVGAFGPNVVKIGMTRRLEPRDRIRELGDASVPFLYDTHALFFSDDAVTLENQLHKAFAHRRVNWVNPRREFFFATPAEIRKVLTEKVGGLLEFVEAPTALEFNQSRSEWPDDITGQTD